MVRMPDPQTPLSVRDQLQASSGTAAEPWDNPAYLDIEPETLETTRRLGHAPKGNIVTNWRTYTLTWQDEVKKETLEDMPATLKRSPQHAQATWAKTHDAAVEQYGEGERAHRTAFASLKHSFEKVGDHWEPKEKRGPSDPRSAQPTEKKREGVGKTFGGVDFYGHTKAELYERAKSLDIEGRSKMNKEQLAEAIGRKQG